MVKPNRREELLQKRDRLLEQLRKERIAWNEYLRGEGILAGHEHSLHEGQETKFQLLEKKIFEIEQELLGKVEIYYIDAEVNGTLHNFVITNSSEAEGDTISTTSPIGSALIKMKKGQKTTIDTPGGEISVKRIF